VEQGVKKEEGSEDAEEAEGGEGDTQALDRLCLALGLLTNLVQVVEDIKDALRGIHLDPACKLKKRACIRQCICSTSSGKSKTPLSALDVLVQLYLHQLPSSTSTPQVKIDPNSTTLELETGRDRGGDTPDASFLRGHLAVLFGLLMERNAMNQAYILGALGREQGDRGKLRRLVEQAREFAAFYAVLSVGAGRRDGHADGDQEVEADALKESKVARDVVLFLESLRDEM